MSRGQAVADIGRKRTPPPSASRPPEAGNRSTAPEASAPVSDSGEHRTRRHHRKRRPFDRGEHRTRRAAGSVRACQRASRPPFDRAAGFATIERAATIGSGDRSTVPEMCRRISATVRAVRFRSIASRARFRPVSLSGDRAPPVSLSGKPSAVRPWRTSNTPRRRKRTRRHHRKRATVRPWRTSNAGNRSTVRPMSAGKDSGDRAPPEASGLSAVRRRVSDSRIFKAHKALSNFAPRRGDRSGIVSRMFAAV